MRARFVAIAAALSLAACAERPKPTVEPRLDVRTVTIPIATPCALKAGPAPAYVDTDEALRAAANVFERAKLVMAGRAQRMARELELMADNSGCR